MSTSFTPLTIVETGQIVIIITTDHYVLPGRVEKFEENVITLLLEDHYRQLANDLYSLYGELLLHRSAVYAYDVNMVEHYQCEFTRQDRPGKWMRIKWDGDNNELAGI